jgi:hypothetical protein
VRIGPFGRVALIMMQLTMCAARVHAHPADAPDVTTQEVNKCLRLVRISASRRHTPPVVLPSASPVWQSI